MTNMTNNDAVREVRCRCRKVNSSLDANECNLSVVPKVQLKREIPFGVCFCIEYNTAKTRPAY